MRLFKPVFGVLVVVVLLARAVASAGIDELPPCAAECLMEALAVSHCADSDLHCQCSGEKSLKGMSACVVDNCTISEAIVFSRATAARCNFPHNNHHVSMKAAVVGSLVAVYVMVGLRVVARFCTAQRFWWDDWCHIFTAVLSIPLSAFAVLCVNGGMGYHAYDIDFSPMGKAQDLSFWYYMCQIFWALVIYFVKMSILALYIRIFPNHIFYRYCIATMILVTISVLIIIPMVIWQCNPMDAIWDLQRKNAYCLSLSGVAYANAAVNMATEVVVLILPIPLLLKLRVSMSSKVALFALFGCGILVIGVASARIPTLEHVEAVNDPTYLNNGVFYWTCAETAVAHVCAAAPAIRPLYLRLKNAHSRNRENEEMTIPNASRTENDLWNSDPSTSKSRTGSEDPMMGSSWIRGWLQRPQDEGTPNTVDLSDLSSSQESSATDTVDYSGRSGGRTQDYVMF